MEIEEIQKIRRLYLFEMKSLDTIAWIHRTNKNKIRLTLERSQREPFPFRSRGRRASTEFTSEEKEEIYNAYFAEGFTMQHLAGLWNTNKMRISRIIKAMN